MHLPEDPPPVEVAVEGAEVDRDQVSWPAVDGYGVAASALPGAAEHGLVVGGEQPLGFLMVHRPVGDERLLDEIPDTSVVLRKTGGFRADGPPVGDLARIPLPVKRTVVGLPAEPVAGFTEHREDGGLLTARPSGQVRETDTFQDEPRTAARGPGRPVPRGGLEDARASGGRKKQEQGDEPSGVRNLSLDHPVSCISPEAGA